MLKTFRRIRQELIDKGNLKRYLIYAIGEILLVVLGILIAFQINSWNDTRKSKYLEKQYLTNIKNEINTSVAKLDESIKFNTTTLNHIENILNHIEGDLPYSGSLDTSFYVYQYFIVPELNFTTYETIKNVGLNSINPNSLRLDISKLYEEEFSFLTNTIKGNEQQYYQNVMTQFHIDHFKETSYLGTTIPNNYDTLKQNQKYSNILYKLKGIRMYSINSIKNVKTKVLEILVSINSRIDSI